MKINKYIPASIAIGLLILYAVLLYALPTSHAETQIQYITIHDLNPLTANHSNCIENCSKVSLVHPNLISTQEKQCDKLQSTYDFVKHWNGANSSMTLELWKQINYQPCNLIP